LFLYINILVQLNIPLIFPRLVFFLIPHCVNHDFVISALLIFVYWKGDISSFMWLLVVLLWLLGDGLLRASSVISALCCSRNRRQPQLRCAGQDVSESSSALIAVVPVVFFRVEQHASLTQFNVTYLSALSLHSAAQHVAHFRYVKDFLWAFLLRCQISFCCST